MRLVKKNSLINLVYSTGINYPAPSNITYMWNFGVFALVCLSIQIISGIVLAMHYAASTDIAFISVEHIMRDVNFGWMLRYIHANGASVFFIVVYLHLLRGLYYGSYIYPREFLWCSGVIILLLMIVTAFLGYILPWGQMSFWGATVITNLASTIPLVGEKLVIWLWGGFAVSNPTLNKFYSLHYLLPFIILGLALLHIVFLHEFGSSNPLGINFKVDQVPLTPYFTIKDFFSIILLLMFFSVLVFFIPNTLGHPDNYIPANPESTPEHIVPEWYFLPFYAILRSIPNKLGGVIALLAAIIVLFFLPFLNNSNIRSSQFRPFYRFGFWFFFIDAIILGWIGGKPIEHPYLIIGQGATAFYFFYLVLLIPIINILEKQIYSNKIKHNNHE